MLGCLGRAAGAHHGRLADAFLQQLVENGFLRAQNTISKQLDSCMAAKFKKPANVATGATFILLKPLTRSGDGRQPARKTCRNFSWLMLLAQLSLVSGALLAAPQDTLIATFSIVARDPANGDLGVQANVQAFSKAVSVRNRCKNRGRRHGHEPILSEIST